jgi:hypothetical protein
MQFTDSLSGQRHLPGDGTIANKNEAVPWRLYIIRKGALCPADC